MMEANSALFNIEQSRYTAGCASRIFLSHPRIAPLSQMVIKFRISVLQNAFQNTKAIRAALLSLLCSFVIANSACSFKARNSVPPNHAFLRIGTWNIQFLSKRILRVILVDGRKEKRPPRDAENARELAQYIASLKVSVLALQEVDSNYSGEKGIARSELLDIIVEELGPQWRYTIGSSGRELHLAYLYDTSVVSLKGLWEPDIVQFGIQRKDILPVDPLMAWFERTQKSEGNANDFLLINLHLQHANRFKDNRLVACVKILDALKRLQEREPQLADEQDIMILGDFNDTSHQSKGFQFLYDYLAARGYTPLKLGKDNMQASFIDGRRLDQIFPSAHARSQTLIPGSLRVHAPEIDPIEYQRRYSDHFPVTVGIR